MISASDAGRIKDAARALGFDLAAFTRAEVPEEDRDFFRRWCDEGRAGDMARWLAREPERRAEPRALLAEALGVITLGVSYFQGELPPPPPVPAGRVARYAWGEDYHEVIQRRLEAFTAELRRLMGRDVRARSALDAQPLLERAFARRAGLGFGGKNTNVIAPRMGSFIFLTELLVDLDLPPDPPFEKPSQSFSQSSKNRPRPAGPTTRPGCGSCTRCIEKCPTGALDVPYALDARLCVAYHTIENRGAIPRDLRPGLGGWLFGCDDCQDVCPYNARAKQTLWPELRAERGAGPWIPLADVLALADDAAFKSRFRGTPLLRAKRAGLVRNACVVAANRGASGALRPLLEERLRRDASPVVRGHAAWALGRSGEKTARTALEAALPAETDPAAREEIAAALEEM